MRVNSINLAMPKANSTAFRAKLDENSNILNQFPLGLKVEETVIGSRGYHDNREYKAIEVIFPEKDPLPGEVAGELYEDCILMCRRQDGCFRAIDPFDGGTVDRLVVTNYKKRNLKNVIDTLNEFVQTRSKARLAQLAEDAAKKVL